jgi:hypothetical protein
VSILSTNIHEVVRTRTQRRQTNGVWTRALEVTCEDGSVLTFTLFSPDRAGTDLIEQPDEYVQVEDVPFTVERSDKPFGEAPLPSASTGAKP